MRTRYGIDPVTGRSALRVVEQTVPARLGDRSRRMEGAVSLELTWWADQPDSVRLAILPAGRGVWAGGWSFPRELLAAGLSQRVGGWASNGSDRLVGHFDAVIQPKPHPGHRQRELPVARVLRVMSDRGPAVVSFLVGPVAEFLDRTYGLVPSHFGTEVDS